MGTGGAAWENGWTEKFRSWPTKDSEKWRYEKIRVCIEATSQSLIEGEEKYQIKVGYESRLKETTEEICKVLKQVASVSENEKQRMRELAREAAKLWLEMGQQRCRMFLIMSSSGEPPARSVRTALDGGTMELVVSPELRRLGNAQGERLDKEELVMNCKGKFSKFPS